MMVARADVPRASVWSGLGEIRGNLNEGTLRTPANIRTSIGVKLIGTERIGKTLIVISPSPSYQRI